MEVEVRVSGSRVLWRRGRVFALNMNNPMGRI